MVLLNGPIESGPVEDVPLFQRPPLGSPRVARRQIVESNGLIPILRQDLAGVRADIACASRYQDRFRGSVIHHDPRTQSNASPLGGPGFLTLQSSPAPRKRAN